MMVMMASPAGFWNFSVAVYAQPAVADLCLRTQDNYGANVNLLLWCIWLEQQQIALTTERLQQAHLRVDSWEQDYVIPLRALRIKLKKQFGTHDTALEALREHIKHAELLAEKQMQVWLESLASSWYPEMDRRLSTGDNLRFYLASLPLPAPMIEAAIHTFANARVR